MWSLLLRSLTLTKGVLVVGVAASAAVVSSPAVSNVAHHEPVPSESASAAPAMTSPASPASREKPKASEAPAQQPSSASPARHDGSSDAAHDELVRGLIKECHEKYTALKAAGDNATQGQRESTEQVCKHAFAESGLSAADFGKLFATVIGGTTTTARPSDKSHDELVQGLIKECATKYLGLKAAGDNATPGQRESTEQVCHHAFAESGLSFEEYAKRIGAVIAELSKAEHPSTSPKPTPAITDELRALVKDCFEKYAAGDKGAYEACKKAIAASGMTTDQFFATFGKPTPPAKPSTSPKPSAQPLPPVTDELRALVKDCFDKYTARDPGAGDACKKAIAASGMTTEQFFAIFGKPTPPAKVEPSSTPKPSASVGPITICLYLTRSLTSTSSQEQIQAASDACAKAIAYTGLTPAEFWAKFGPAPH